MNIYKIRFYITAILGVHFLERVKGYVRRVQGQTLYFSGLEGRDVPGE